MEQIIIFLFTEGYGLWITGWCFVCMLFTSFAPVSLTEKIPDVLMQFINYSAGNFKYAANKLTDIKGNTA